MVSFVILAPTGVALAQTPALPAGAHPRRAEVTFLMVAPVSAVLVSETEVWAPQVAAEPLSICVLGRACVPIARQETCAPPHCPGAGPRLVAATDYKAAFYMRMSFPIAWAVSSSVALELRPSLTLVDAWVEGGKSEVMLGASLGAIIF